ncbi:hypothetical protein KC338_g1 [Hortaea werneckii]|nr:hypothetical protein KC338_g1 [Hortaea werneckii]
MLPSRSSRTSVFRTRERFAWGLFFFFLGMVTTGTADRHVPLFAVNLHAAASSSRAFLERRATSCWCISSAPVAHLIAQ